ncbi:hypothetical protein [Pectobacterium brasiliense]|uniref:hypothetical protein n=1 Tax=Pectobacterium brasiliense TaxID=180957 RepID=UPI0019695D65|nr:hypothetical protein [Pectobacterium brasiliense]MBN3262932.1 hypothetical protein [Pectobacterium brasiliense]
MLDDKEKNEITEQDLHFSFRLAEEVERNSSYDVGKIAFSFLTAFFLASGIFIVFTSTGVNNVYYFAAEFVFCLIAILNFGSNKVERELTSQEINKLTASTTKYRESLFEYMQTELKTYVLTRKVIIKFNQHYIQERDIIKLRGSEKELVNNLKINN